MQRPRAITTRPNKVGECPVWDRVDQCLYWVDFDLDLLFVTSIQPANAPAVAGCNGLVHVIDAGVRGLPEPVFSGELPVTV